LNIDRQFWAFLISLGVLIFVLGSFFRPSFNGSCSTPRLKSACNLRQIGEAILLYSNDFQGQYPDSFQTMLLNEDITSSVFVSPSRAETAAQGATMREVADDLDSGGHVSYVYLGRGLSMKTATPDMVIAYEMPDRDGGGNVLFGDLHVEYFDGSVLSKIVGRVATGEFPVTMPSTP
jgi:prepilin-type processing-associated H-X9-DG protein